ncbi:MAG: hypothetical protein ABIT71_09075 [Vicinamibacteraceae bacterium]
MGADAFSRRRVLMTKAITVIGTAVVASALVASGGGVAAVRAQAPDSLFHGHLAKAVFLSDRVGEAIAQLASTAPAASRVMLTEAAARARGLKSPAVSANTAVRWRQERSRAIAEGIVALVATPEASAESAAASEALLAPDPMVHDTHGISIPLGLAESAEGYLKAHRESAVTPYLYAYLMVQYRSAFERQAKAKALEGQKTSAKKYRAFRLRALASTDPLVKAVAEDIDAQLYLHLATAEHPRNFDPDACCRDK